MCNDQRNYVDHQRNGSLPTSYEEKQSFKAQINALKRKIDEENFEEAEAQAFRLWSEKPVPTDVAALFELAPLPQDPNQAFHVLLKTLKLFIEKYGAVPLTSSLPDMKTDTASYVRLQNLYKEQAKVENVCRIDCISLIAPYSVSLTLVHRLNSRSCSGRVSLILRSMKPRWMPSLRTRTTSSCFAEGSSVLSTRIRRRYVCICNSNIINQELITNDITVNSLQIFPKETLTHLSISALTELLSRETDLSAVTAETLTQEVQSLVGQGIELQPELNDAVGELYVFHTCSTILSRITGLTATSVHAHPRRTYPMSLLSSVGWLHKRRSR